MSKKEKDIELIPTANEASGWKVKHDGKEGSGPGPQSYPKVKFDLDSGPHLMVFKLPKTGNVTFNATNPIAIKPGVTSPPEGSGMDPQFPDWDIFDNGKTLVVLDRNSGDPQLFAYTIKADNWTKSLDPIVDNGGGVGGFYGATSLWVAAGIGLLCAAVFFFIGRAYQRNLK